MTGSEADEPAADVKLLASLVMAGLGVRGGDRRGGLPTCTSRSAESVGGN